MASSLRRNEVCRGCLSADGELISLFPNDVDSSAITEKIMNIRKEDGLPEKICKKCVYLVESFDCFKKQLIGSDRSLRKLWNNERDKLSAESSTRTEFANNKDTERDELDYDIEWISDEEKILVEAAFRRKWMNDDKKKLEDCEVSRSIENAQIIPLNCIENKIIKIEAPDDFIQNDFSANPEELEKSIKKEATDDAVDESRKHAESMEKKVTKKRKSRASVKARSVKRKKIAEDTEKIVKTEKPDVSSEKSVADENSEISDTKIDQNVIVISDGSVESDSYDNRRKTSRDVAHSDEVLGIDGNKGSSIVNAERARKKRAAGVSRKYFQCTTCKVNLYTVAAVLLHHNQVHTAQKDSLSCRMCDARFPTKTDLFVHFNLHTESHLFRCSRCPNEFVLKNNLLKHMNEHGSHDFPLQPKDPSGLDTENRAEDNLETSQKGSVKIDTTAETREDFGSGNVVNDNSPAPNAANFYNETMDREENSEKENIDCTDNSAGPVDFIEDDFSINSDAREKSIKTEDMDDTVDKSDEQAESVAIEAARNEKPDESVETEPVQSDNFSEDNGKSDESMEIELGQSDNLIEDNEKPDESMEIELVQSDNFIEDNENIVDNEKLNDAVHSETSDREKKFEIFEVNVDPNAILGRCQDLSAPSTNLSGITSNENTSCDSPVCGETSNGARIAVHSEKVLGIDRKKRSLILKADGARKIRLTGMARKYFQCTTCRVNLYTVAAVLVHHNQVHTAPKDSLSCRMCDTTFPTKEDLFAHFDRHTESHLFRCSHCPNEFVLKNSLTRHMNEHKTVFVPDCQSQQEDPSSLVAEPRAEDNPEARQNENTAIASTTSGEIREHLEIGNIVNNNSPEEANGKENIDPAVLLALRVGRNVDENFTGQDQQHDEKNKENTIMLDRSIL